jgi:hypothetical protein
VREEAVGEAAEGAEPDGEEDVAARAYRLEAGESKQILDVADGGPVQEGQRILEAERLEQMQHGLPHPAVPVDDDPRSRMRDGAQPLEGGPDVEEIAYEIGQDDVVERAIRQLEPLRRGLAELEMGMTVGRLLDHGPRQVHPHPFRRLEGGQEVGGAAADLEHTRAARHVEARGLGDALVVAGVAGTPVTDACRVVVEEGFEAGEILVERGGRPLASHLPRTADGVAGCHASWFSTRSADPRRMKCGSLSVRVGTEVGLSMVRRARRLVGPGAPRAPRTAATGDAPESALSRLR